VLLPLGRKQHSYVQGHSFCLHYTLCLMQLSIVRNLILEGCSDDIPVSGLLVIDAVGWRSMYFVLMTRVNLIVILMTYACYLYSINCPTVICLPSMLLSILLIKQNPTKRSFKLSISTCKLSTSHTILANQLSTSSN
jgi:hypothetical protein